MIRLRCRICSQSRYRGHRASASSRCCTPMDVFSIVHTLPASLSCTSHSPEICCLVDIGFMLEMWSLLYRLRHLYFIEERCLCGMLRFACCTAAQVICETAAANQRRMRMRAAAAKSERSLSDFSARSRCLMIFHLSLYPSYDAIQVPRIAVAVGRQASEPLLSIHSLPDVTCV